MPLRVVVDTNVWVSGLILPESTPGHVLEVTRERRLEPVMNWELGQELVTVLERPRLRRFDVQAAAIKALLEIVRPFLPTVEIDAPVRDEKDAPVIAAAIAGNARIIVSGDGDLLDDEALANWLAERGIEVVRPADIMQRLGS